MRQLSDAATARKPHPCLRYVAPTSAVVYDTRIPRLHVRSSRTPSPSSPRLPCGRLAVPETRLPLDNARYCVRCRCPTRTRVTVTNSLRYLGFAPHRLQFSSLHASHPEPPSPCAVYGHASRGHTWTRAQNLSSRMTETACYRAVVPYDLRVMELITEPCDWLFWYHLYR